ncbi:MAG: nucleotide exchange factor GrpE [Deltaproteobacteria bacterium]|nr:nucleotide exchange factor GrpE [Deltaproteobacteria bacterium]
MAQKQHQKPEVEMKNPELEADQNQEPIEEMEAAKKEAAAAEQREKERELEELRSVLRIKELEAKVSGYESKLSDIRAYVKKMEEEVSQIRFRAERDLQKNLDQQNAKIFMSLLPIVDNFDRSLQAASGESASAFSDGMQMIYKQLKDFLAKSGLEKIEANGTAFDPQFHEAVAARAVDEKDLDDVIVEEVQAGYKYKDQVIRPAQVVVGKLAN